MARHSNALVSGLLRAGLVEAGLAAVLLIAAVPWVIDNNTRPLVGFSLPAAISRETRLLPVGESIFNTPRSDLYFAKRPLLKDPYAKVAARAAETGCREIALWSGPDGWEYPLWALTRESGEQARVDQIFIINESAHVARFGSQPCLLVVLAASYPTVQIDGVYFTLSWSQDGVSLYERSLGG